MQQADAQLMLAQRMVEHASDPIHIERATSARHTVAQRQPMVEEAHVLDSPSAEPLDHIEDFTVHADYQLFEVEGWTVRIADLSRVIALQPIVFWDHAQERTRQWQMISLDWPKSRCRFAPALSDRLFSSIQHGQRG